MATARRTDSSVGVVTEREAFRESRMNVEGWFRRYTKATPTLAAAMRHAKPVNELKSEGDYSYSMERFTGNGFVLIGDAARFVDPIFSSGVSVALYSAKFAAEQIKVSFETGDFSRSAFLPYEQRLRGGTDIWYEFICLYYKLLPIFTHFIASEEHRLQVLQLLQGEVYDRSEAPVLNAMKEFIEVIETSESHVFKDQLTDISIG